MTENNNIKIRKSVKSTPKGDETRAKILTAAQKVFTIYPYHAASLRRIGTAGGFEHPLVRYYYRTKKDVFKAFARSLFSQTLNDFFSHIDKIDRSSLSRGFRSFINLYIDHSLRNPNVFKIIMLNLGSLGESDTAPPNLNLTRKAMFNAGAILYNFNLFKADMAREVYIWLMGLLVGLSNFVGASSFHAGSLGMDEHSREYRDWICDTIFFLFYPSLRTLVNNDSSYTRDSGLEIEIPGPAQIQKQDITEPGATKGDISSKKIISSARSVFSRLPYGIASLRTIGKEGGFDFTLAYHYFKSKDELFEAVVSDIFEEYQSVDVSLISEALRVTLNSSLAENTLHTWLELYIDWSVDFFTNHPDGLMILMQNIAGADIDETRKHIHRISEYNSSSLRILINLMPMQASEADKQRWIYGMSMITYNFIGTLFYSKLLMDIELNSDIYRQIVKDMLMFLFYPSLKKLYLAKA